MPQGEVPDHVDALDGIPVAVVRVEEPGELGRDEVPRRLDGPQLVLPVRVQGHARLARGLPVARQVEGGARGVGPVVEDLVQDLGDHGLGNYNPIRPGLVLARGVGVEDLLLGDEDAGMRPEEGEEVGEVVDAEDGVEEDGEHEEAEEGLDDAARRGRLWDLHHDISCMSLDTSDGHMVFVISDLRVCSSCLVVLADATYPILFVAGWDGGEEGVRMNHQLRQKNGCARRLCQCYPCYFRHICMHILTGKRLLCPPPFRGWVVLLSSLPFLICCDPHQEIKK